jgi:spermidine synthase
MSSVRRTSLALLLLFVLSGVAGLIYQSIWSHYLGLTLGHAAYAQALVLAIFMGGMALGAWLASRWSPRLGSLVLAYAIVEGVIGILGLIFHGVFVGYTTLSQQHVLPSIANPTIAHAYQWASAALLIAPQCILLGATFPLLSAGLLRLGEESEGRVLGGLYFSNSIGACAGALLTTFVLLPMVGMPGSVLTGGLLNVLVALIAWALWKRLPKEDSPVAPSVARSVRSEAAVARSPHLARVLMVGAAITGGTSFVYEIGWVRLLNQVLGTTIHSFELMLAAFILGLACGGLWIRFRGSRVRDPIAYAGYAQLLMGMAALLSLVAFAQSFHWVGWVMQAVQRSDQGYVLFSVGGALVSLLVMFPAAFFAGMTLPLFTMAMLEAGEGEAAIGKIYAANTLGAIIGVVAMMHLLIPAIGVRLSVVVAALADAALGLYLLRRISPARRTTGYAIAGLATAATLAIALLLGKIDPLQQVAGVFRTGNVRPPDAKAVPYLRDGKTATVSVVALDSGAAAISTNGKPDAALSLSLKAAPTPDEVTMIMAGALPLMQHPDPKRIAVIGWGSGLTTHTLASSDLPREIETIEIERAMYDGARLFGTRVERAYRDPRSQLQVEDARTYFATGNRKYDVVISEPSNPWVSGVASLFTREFYGFVRSHLNEGGMLVQWIHSYELNDRLFGTMVAALIDVFPDSDLYVTNTSDFIFVARSGAPSSERVEALLREPLATELKRVGLRTPEEFALRRVAGPRVLATYVRHLGVKPYSDFFPVVSLNAPRSRFKQESADTILLLADNGLPVLDFLEGRKPVPSSRVARNEDSRLSERRLMANAVRTAMLSSDTSNPDLARFGMDGFVSSALQMGSSPVTEGQMKHWSNVVSNVADTTLGLLPPEELRELWTEQTWQRLDGQPPAVGQLMALYAATAQRDARAMADTSHALLKSPAFKSLADPAREQVLVIAQLAAVGLGQPQEIRRIDEEFGRGIPLSHALGYIRSYLLAWADQPATSAG